MSNTSEKNIFTSDIKLVDLTGLEKYHEKLKSKFIVNNADNGAIGIDYDGVDEGDSSVNFSMSDNVDGDIGASITVDDFDNIAHSGLTINDGYTKIVGETQTGSSETSGGSIVLTSGSVNMDVWVDDPNGGAHYSNNLSLNENGLLLNGSEVITTQNAYANGVLLVNSQNVSNRNELTIGGFEIKNVTPYNYTIEASYLPEDPEYFYDQFSDYGECIITAEWDKNEPVMVEHRMINPDLDIYDEYIYAYKFIITDARVLGVLNDDSEGTEQWYDYQKPVNTEVFIPAGYLDEEYRDIEHDIHPIVFIDGQGSLPGSIYIDSVDQLNDITVSQYAPMSLRHTSKALLNGVEVATVDQIPEIPEMIDAYTKTESDNKYQVKGNYALKSDIPTIPEAVISKGTADNSAVLDGEYNNYSNKAISQVSTSFGAASTAGLKGWYYTKVNLSENLIWLSDTRSTGILQIKISTTTSTTPDNTSFVCGWKAGDEVTIVNDKKYDRCAKIEAINGNMIKLDKLPFDSETIVTSAPSIGNYNEPDEFSITAIKITDNDTLKTRSLSSYDKGNVDFGGGAHAEGVQTYALNIGAHAEGIQSVAHGQYSHTEGFKTEAAYAAHAEGRYCKAIGRQSHAEGEYNEAYGDNSHVEGKNSKTLSKFSHAEGNTTIAKGEASHTEGYKTISVNNTSHAEGSQTVAYGGNAHAEGQGGSYDVEIYNKTKEEVVAIWDADMKINCALGKSSHTEGLNTLASGDYSHAEGQYTKAAGSDSHAEGNQTKALENNAHAEGVSTIASGNAAHAEGNTTTSSGKASHAEGIQTNSSNEASHAEGYKTEASGLYAHAEGNETNASGKYSHTEGYMTEATTNNAHAEGNQTKAQGNSAHAEGKLTVAANDFSHAGGLSSTASGVGSFAHGNYVMTTKDYEIAFGKYNASNEDTIFSVGNGADENNRSNILEIKNTLGETGVNYQAPKTNIVFNIDVGNNSGLNSTYTILEITYVSSNDNYATYKIIHVDETNYKIGGFQHYIHTVDSTEHLVLSVGDLLYVPIEKPTWESDYDENDSEDRIIGYANNRCMYINSSFTKNNAIYIIDNDYNPGVVQLIESAVSSLFVNGSRVLVEDDEYINNTKSEILAESKAYTDDKLKDIDIDIDIPFQSDPNGGIITINDDSVRSNVASGKSSFAMGGYVADSGNTYDGCNAIGSASFSGGVNNYSNGICSFTYGFGLNTTTTSQKYGEAAFGKYNNSTTDTLFSIGFGSSNDNRKNVFEVKTNGCVYAASFATGDHTLTTKNNEVAFGKYNKSDDDTVFSIGGGVDNKGRKNLFEVKAANITNGMVYAYVNDEIIATRTWVETNYPTGSANVEIASIDEIDALLESLNLVVENNDPSASVDSI